ncbi:hypothetical protein Tco_0640709 [Tanacetum coccineum]
MSTNDNLYCERGIHQTEKAKNEQKALKGLHILLAEDAPIFQRLATIMFEQMGAKVVVVLRSWWWEMGYTQWKLSILTIGQHTQIHSRYLLGLQLLWWLTCEWLLFAVDVVAVGGGLYRVSIGVETSRAAREKLGIGSPPLAAASPEKVDAFAELLPPIIKGIIIKSYNIDACN